MLKHTTYNASSSDRVDEAPELSRRTLLQAAGAGLAALSCSLAGWAAVSKPAAAAVNTIDFRYSPAWWQTSICFPDDPDKALVGKEGQLLFDYGLRADKQGRVIESDDPDIDNFSLSVLPDCGSGARWIRQSMASPRAPIIQTWRDADGVEISEQTFLVTPGPGDRVPSPSLARVDFAGGMIYGFAKPALGSAPAFANVAVALEGPIRFQLAVDPGAAVTLVFGLCEGRVTEPGARLLVLSAEGGEARTVDAVKDFGASQPGLYKLMAHDENGDGVIDISISAPADSPQREAVLSALWAFSGAVPEDNVLISGHADNSAIASFPDILQPQRRAIVLMTLKNSTPVTATRQPVLRIRSGGHVHLNEVDKTIHVENGVRISGSAALTLALTATEGEVVAQMAAVTLPPGGSHKVAFAVDRRSFGPVDPLSADQAGILLRAAEKWWENYDLPYSSISVPDRGIQDMVESCVRNIWQARELKIGGPAFEVGPTCYRGLWVVDGSFLLESAAILGRGLEARKGVEYLIGQQKPDGSFETLPHYWKENGIMLWAATRHAFLTQDKEWLRRYWPALQSALGVIRRMRDEVSRNPQALNYRLMPGGFVDGGIDNMKAAAPEYSTVYWTLAGMKSFIVAARWLSDEATAACCESDYNDFYAVFRQACARDVLEDGRGNAYVPIMMGNAESYVPQKGQWSFCHAVYPGQVFPKDDPLVKGQLAMLRATEVEGMVLDTGWIKDGIWTYFAPFYAHAQLWQGQGREAVESLYAFAQHASPTRVWREEQRPLGQPPRKGDSAGDMPHNWASAEFIRLVAHLIELDRGDELHLLEGFPREWAQPGMVTRLDGVLTPFGPLHLEIRISEDGRSALLKMKQLKDSPPTKIVLHLGDWAGRNEVAELATDREVVKSIKLRVPSRNG
jgi:hypothetical protein